MVEIKFTSALKRFFPDLQTTFASSGTIKSVLQEIEQQYPGISHYLVDEQMHLRKHVNIFINGQLLGDEKDLETVIEEGQELYFIQALSGG